MLTRLLLSFWNMYCENHVIDIRIHETITTVINCVEQQIVVIDIRF